MTRPANIVLFYLEKMAVSVEDYGGLHRPPDPSHGAPLHNLTVNGKYPEDVYSQQAIRYYGQHDPADGDAYRVIQEARGNPRMMVTVYRAVPYQLSSKELVKRYEKQKAYILKYGKVPPGVETSKDRSDYYDWLSDEIDRLKAIKEDPGSQVDSINRGDWVTISRRYAKEHGEGNLRGEYKILSAKVRAGDLFTEGDSWLEWGYYPGAYSKKAVTTPRIPKALQGLAAEVRKAGSFEEFEKDYLREIKHGTYWHWTEDPDFKIDPSKGPQDMSSLSTGRVDPGKLMVTSHLEYWSDYGSGGKGRPYAALIDMSDVPREAYKQVNRGFGNEFIVSDPSRARVEAVYPRRRAFQVDRERARALPQSNEELEEFYDRVIGQVPARSPREPVEASSSPAQYDELVEREKSGTITGAERQRVRQMVDEAAKKAGYGMTLYRGDRPGKTSFTGREDKSVRLPGNIFLFDDPKLAKFYTSQRTNYMRDWGTMGPEDGLYALKVNLGDRVLKVDAKDEDWSQIEAPDEVGGKDKYPWGIQIDSLAEKARKKGYTAVVVDNVGYQAGWGAQYIVFSPSQIKSAEPFVFQDDGTVVPLERRFVPKEDIRGDVSTMRSKTKGRPSPLKVAGIYLVGSSALENALQHRGMRGDDLLNAIDLVESLREKGGVVDDDGMATLFHRTTPESARAIVKEQRMTSKEDGLFFGTKPTGQIEGYGDAVVKVVLPVEKLELNDEFADEYHVRMPTGTIGKKVPVHAYPMDSNRKASYNFKSRTPPEIAPFVPEMARAAQEKYDEWEQDDDGMDAMLGAGGLCQDIAEALAEVLDSHGVDASTVSSSVGDQHVWVVARAADGVYTVDIEPRVYETGSGYVWRKRPGVRFKPQDIDVTLIDPDPSKYEEYSDDM